MSDYSAKGWLILSSLVLSLLFLTSCGNTKLEKKKQAPSVSNIFTEEQNLLFNVKSQNKTSQETCSVTTTPFLYKHQELQATISSNQMTKVQVAVEPSMDFTDLKTTNGVLTWPGNTFEPNAYVLKFRGINSDGSTINCNPAMSAITILDTPSPEIPSENSASNCSVDLPSTLFTNQELQATITSNKILKIQTRIEPNLHYVDLAKTSGVLQFPANLFQAGSYQLHFRGIKSDGSSIVCNPTHRNIVVNTPPAPSNTTSVTNSNYYALNSNIRGVDFKSAFSPDKVYYDGNFALLQSTAGTNSASGLSQLRIFVPPGTVQISVTTSAYLADEDGKVAASFRTLPRARASDITSNTTYSGQNLLSALLEKAEEVHFYAPPRSGGIMLLNPGAERINPVQNGGWLYLNFLSIPGGTIYNIQTRVTVDKNCYQNWYRQAVWDTSGNPTEGAQHRCN